MTKITVDDYLIDVLLPDLAGHDRQPSAFLVYLFLYRWTEGVRKRCVGASLREIAEGTGLSKRCVQAAVSRLQDRRLILVSRKNATDIPVYSIRKPWCR